MPITVTKEGQFVDAPYSHNEGLLDTLILAVQDAIIDGEGHLTKHYLEYALKRHDLQLVDVRGDGNV